MIFAPDEDTPFICTFHGASYHDPMVKRALDKRLCSVELHAPTQLRSDQAFTLFAVLNFDVKQERSRIEDRVYSLRYGFHAAELRLRLDKCSMEPTGRYVKVLQPRTIKMENEKETRKTREGDGKLGLGFPDIFGFVTIGGRVSSARHSAVSARVIETGILEIACAVVQRHGDYWRLYGIENADGVLCGQLLGDEKLCDIKYEGSTCGVSVEVVADLADLWLQIDGESQAQVIMTANKQAVCAALAAKSLRNRAARFSGEEMRGPVVLATDKVSVRGRPATARGV